VRRRKKEGGGRTAWTRGLGRERAGRFPLPRTCVRGRTGVRAFAHPRGAQHDADVCGRRSVYVCGCVCARVYARISVGPPRASIVTGGWIGNAHAPTAENLPSQGKSASETRRGCVPLCYIQCRVGERSPQRSVKRRAARFSGKFGSAERNRHGDSRRAEQPADRGDVIGGKRRREKQREIRAEERKRERERERERNKVSAMSRQASYRDGEQLTRADALAER